MHSRSTHTLPKLVAFPRGRQPSPHFYSSPPTWSPSATRPLHSSSSSLLPTPSKPSYHLSTSSSTSPNPTPSSSSFNTVNADEIAHFSRLSSKWWDEKGEFGLLHRMNPPRMQFVREKILKGKQDDNGWSFKTRNEASSGKGIEDGKWLAGLDVLDVGCGGGLLTESLSRVGANALGIDASPANISIASLHASQDLMLPYTASPPSPSSSGPALRYRHTSAEDLQAEGAMFDVVCSMEVLEHVDAPGEFLKCLGSMVKPGGHLILSTINRTPLSQLLTITLAEHVLRLVTPGTHTYSKFIKPSELLAFVRDHMGGRDVWESDGDGLVREDMLGGLLKGPGDAGGIGVGEVRGIVYHPLGGEWKLWEEGVPGGEMCNYMFHLRKKKE